MISYKMIGDRIRKARQKINISSDKLAELLDVTPSYMRRVESGTEKINLQRLAQVSEIIKEPIEFLIVGTVVTRAEEANYEFLKMVAPLKNEDIDMILEIDRTIIERMKK